MNVEWFLYRKVYSPNYHSHCYQILCFRSHKRREKRDKWYHLNGYSENKTNRKNKEAGKVENEVLSILNLELTQHAQIDKHKRKKTEIREKQYLVSIEQACRKD